MKKKVVSLALAVLMLVSAVSLAGCKKEEPPIAADKVAVALFDMILKDDASSAVELFGYADEAEAREALGLDGGIYETMADELVSQFSGMGLTVTNEEMQAFVNAFIAMFKNVKLTATVKESDEETGAAVVTCTVNTFDPDNMTTAMTSAMTKIDPSLLESGSMEAAFGAILKAMADVIADIEPTDETADFDVNFELKTMDVNGKDRKVWMPKDAAEFGNLISTTAMGG